MRLAAMSYYDVACDVVIYFMEKSYTLVWPSQSNVRQPVFCLPCREMECAERSCWAFLPTMRLEGIAGDTKFWYRKDENSRWDDKSRDFEKALILLPLCLTR